VACAAAGAEVVTDETVAGAAAGAAVSVTGMITVSAHITH